MRKTLAVAVVLGLVAGALAMPAEAKKKKKKKRVERTATSTYEAPALGSGTGVCLGATNSCGNLAVGSDEKWVMVSIEDAAGLPVYATIGQDLDGDTFTDVSTTICGASEEPWELVPGVQLTIFPWAVGRANCPGIATTGTVTATFSNLP